MSAQAPAHFLFPFPLKAHPHLKTIDQDLEAVLAKAKNVGV